MSTLRRTTLTVPVAHVGPDNPLPALTPRADPHAGLVANDADAEMSRNLARGHLRSLLPYTMQDGYGRERSPEEVDALVLANDQLEATFLPGWGGRLWSLVHRPTDRQLLYRNPVLQPANFALRDAWVAGGVEWNIGATGHWPLTCAPVHAARVVLDDGTPVLRLYEWERMRGVAFQVDAWLPDGSAVLLVRVRIVNPQDAPVPMYWWTNIAVPEGDDVRVLAPADTAYHFSYDKRLRVVPVPAYDGRDVSYPAGASDSADYFFECAKAARPWIAAVDESGRGLVQASTAALRGRKLFCWGRSTGGRHWQQFLSGEAGGDGYCEIQAGLARTQLEHLSMPAGAQWSWVETFGPIELEPAVAHGAWHGARAGVESALDGLLAGRSLDDVHTTADGWADLPPAEALYGGSGWGALERRLRERSGGDALGLPGLPFPDASLGEVERPWLRLLEVGALPEADPADAPPSYVTGLAWQRFLDRAPDGWFTWLHRGVVRWAAGEREEASEAWRRSHADTPNGWALRNLGRADQLAGRVEAAAEQLAAAHRLLPWVWPLTIEALAALIDAGRPDAALDLVDGLDDTQRSAGRTRFLHARAALAAGDTYRAGRILEDGLVVPDLREGEDALSVLWQDYCAALRQAGKPRADERLPYVYDFRMHTAAVTPSGSDPGS
ncbi:MAG: DUF5107 domain-containing protein [Streptosporangiales bacterium]